MAEFDYPTNLRYTSDHEWVEVNGDVVRVGITSYAQDALGDVVFVTLPNVGDTLRAGDSCGEVESTKSVSDLYAPVSGEVVQVNEELQDAPETLNTDPYGEGWIYQMRVSDADELDGLMDAADYEKELP